MTASRGGPRPPGGRPGVTPAALGIFAFALVLRVLHLLEIRGELLFDLRIGDGLFYDTWARQIAAGDWIGDGVFWYAPLYPYFLGAVYATLGDDGLVVRLIQAVIGACSCVLIADAGRRLFSVPAGIAAGLILAVYGPAIFYDGLVHKPVLVMFFLCLVLWNLGRRVLEPGRPLSWLGFGAAIGGLILARENTMIFVVVVLAWVLLDRRNRGGRRALLAGAFLLGLLIVLVPVAARNKVVGGELHLTAANFGDNFYKGNNERSDGSYVPLRPGRGNPEFERQDATELAERALGRRLSPSEVSGYWTRQALEYMVSQPADWLLLTARKFLLVWNATEIGDAEDMYTYAGWSTTLRVARHLCHFGVIAPLALFGVWTTWPGRRRLWPLHAMLLLYTVSVVAFYVFGRYRYPMVPFLVLFAAAGLVQARGLLRRSAMPALVLAAAATVAAAVFCNWPVEARNKTRMTTHWNLAVTFENNGRIDEAIGQYRSALRFAPDNPEARHQLGNLLRSQGRNEEAIEHLARAVELDPGNVLAHNNLAIALRSAGRPDEAIRHYEQALSLDPGSALAHFNLAQALRSRGDLEGALRHYREAMRIAPDSAATNYNLGLAWLLATHPEPEIRDTDEAIRLAERAASVTGRESHEVLDVLAATYAACGRFEDAVRTAGEALSLAEAAGSSRAGPIRERLELYRQGQSYRDPVTE